MLHETRPGIIQQQNIYKKKRVSEVFIYNRHVFLFQISQSNVKLSQSINE